MNRHAPRADCSGERDRSFLRLQEHQQHPAPKTLRSTPGSPSEPLRRSDTISPGIPPRKELVMSETTAAFATTALSGYELLADPQFNKGTAFSETERDAFDLHGLLPPNVATLAEQ